MAVTASIKKGFGVATHSMTIVGLLSLFGFVWSLLNIYYAPKIQAQTQTPDPKLSILIMIATVIFILVSIFLQSGTLGYVRDKIKQGNANLSAFMGAGSKYYIKLFVVGLIIALTAMVFILVAALAVAFLKKPGFFIAVPVALAAIYFILLMFFAPYIVVVNEEKSMAAIKKSIGLVKKNLLGVLGISAILVAIGFVIGLLAGVILGLMNVAAPGVVSQVAYAVLSSVLNAFLGVFVTASFMNFYMEISNTAGA